MEAWLRPRYFGDGAGGRPGHAKSQISNLFQYVTVCTILGGAGVTCETLFVRGYVAREALCVRIGRAKRSKPAS